MSNTYHEIKGNIDGEREVLFGSFDHSDCTYELDAERSTWYDQGYRRIKIESRSTNDEPDPEVYNKEYYFTAAYYQEDPEQDHREVEYTFQAASDEAAIKHCETFYDLANSGLIGAMLMDGNTKDEVLTWTDLP